MAQFDITAPHNRLIQEAGLMALGRQLGRGWLVGSYRDIYPAMIAVAMVLIGIAGALMTQLLARVERRVIRWR